MVRQLSADETAYFCEQLALMLDAGMGLSNGLEILCEDIDDKKVRTVCDSLMTGLNDNKTLGQSMDNSGFFPEYSVKMVKIGETTGQIQKVLNDLAGYYQTQADLSRAVRSSFFHPLMLLVMMTAVVVVLILLVIPMFGDIFSQFNASVRNVVRNTVDFAYGFGIILLVILALIIFVSVTCMLLMNCKSVKKAFLRFASIFPLTRRISNQLAMAKIAGAMNTMVKSGMTPVEMLETAVGLIDNVTLEKKLITAKERVIEGEYFADVISGAEIFPAIYAKSIRIAYTSGHFDDAWAKLAEQCSERAMESIAGIVSFIEPAIVIVLTVIIGAVLLSVMVPLVNIMSVLG